MSGIVGNGFMGRGGGVGPWRYLHDEISGGIFSVSHIKTRAAYSGHCVNIGTSPNQTNYGFTNNIIPLSQVNSDFGSDQNVNTFYDQFENNDVGLGAALWRKTQNDFFTSGALGLTKAGPLAGGFSTLNLADEMSFMMVIEDPLAAQGTLAFLLYLQGASSSEIRLQWFSDNSFAAQINSVAFSRRQWNIGRNADQKLIILTKSSGTTNASWSLYQDDMTTAAAVATNAGSGTPTNRLMNSGITLGSRPNLFYTGFIKEFSIFNKTLSQTERQTAKEILEQYYTFS